MSRRPWQKLWLRVHWWLGLFAGAMFVLSGLTGSTLVFYQVLDAWLNPERLTTSGRGSYRSFDEMTTAARMALPDVPGPYLLLLPSDNHGVVAAWFKKSTGERGRGQEIEVAVDPYRSQVLSNDRIWGSTLVSIVYEFHQSLLLETVGETILGIFALFLLLSVTTGLYLWWPRPGRIREAFTIKSGGSRLRRLYDLHKLSGISGALILFVLAFTGLYLEFPAYVSPLVGSISLIPEEPVLRSNTGSESRPISIDQAVTIARSIFPSGELKWIGLPQQRDDVYQIGLRQPDEVRRSSGESIVWLDQYSGEVLHTRDWHRLAGGETFLAWLFPLHNGEAFGLIGRWIVFVTGFIPSVLYATALRMWWLKQRTKKVAQERRPTPATAAHP
jgi:uncharacterized iron-regulated membrane protein